MIFCALVLLALLSVAMGAPDEASGIVTYVVAGDTFDIQIEHTDPRIKSSVERIRLADVDSPEMSTPEGILAKDFTAAILLDKKVWLDIDDKAEDGRGPYGWLICVVYLAGLDGQPISSPSFNRILVDSGHAVVKDYTNEFDPDDWWPSEESVSKMAPEITTKLISEVKPGPAPIVSGEKKFVGSIKSNKYHYPWCKWAKKISPQNEIWFSSSEDARAHGYVPCKVCNPP